MADVPYLFLVYPKNVFAYSTNVWKKDTIVDQSGIGVKNFWTFVGADAGGQQKDMVLNTAEASTPSIRSTSRAPSTAG